MQKSIVQCDSDLWGSLNLRQQKYLAAIYRADQDAESYNRTGWRPGRTLRRASEWRWLPFTGDGGLRLSLGLQNLIDEGSGNTLAALSRRKLIELRSESSIFGRELIFVKMTTLGRKVARAGLGEPVPPKLPPGTLRDYQWHALLMVYNAGTGLEGDEDCWIYGNIGWNTWQRLYRYKFGALVEDSPVEVCRNGFTYHEQRLFVTEYGKRFVLEQWDKYREFYPDEPLHKSVELR